MERGWRIMLRSLPNRGNRNADRSAKRIGWLSTSATTHQSASRLSEHDEAQRGYAINAVNLEDVLFSM